MKMEYVSKTLDWTIAREYLQKIDGEYKEEISSMCKKALERAHEGMKVYFVMLDLQYGAFVTDQNYIGKDEWYEAGAMIHIARFDQYSTQEDIEKQFNTVKSHLKVKSEKPHYDEWGIRVS